MLLKKETVVSAEYKTDFQRNCFSVPLIVLLKTNKKDIKLDSKHFKALKKSKKDNYAMIYNNAAALSKLDTTVKPMMSNIYEQLLDDVNKQNKKSPIYTQHIDFINNIHYKRKTPYEINEPNQLVVDYIASMTDDYLVELHHYLFPNSDLTVEYKGYFDSLF